VDHPRADQPDAERIHRLAALPNLEMQVRPGRQPAGADIADQLPGVDEAARLGDDLAHVPVEAHGAAAMRDLHLAAIAAGPAGPNHLAVSGGDDRTAPTR